MFMDPRNILRVKEAVLSVLAGDVFGKTPIRPSLMVFKGIYYSINLLNLPRTIKAWRMRKHNIRTVQIDGMSN